MTPAELVRSYLDAFSTADAEDVARHVTDDFVNEHTAALGSGCEGKIEYLRRLPNFFAAMKHLRYEVEDVLGEGDHAAAAYTMHAITNDHAVAVRGVMWFVIRDGLIAKRTDYWDSQVFQRQAGVL